MDISHILSAERLSDGGSLCVHFQSMDSCSYWFLIPILNMNDKLFGEPVLVNRTTRIEVDMSWEQGLVWEKKLRQFVSDNTDVEILNEIKIVIEENIRTGG